ncbi:MAG: glucose-1-phosphate adenylyltransferase subunit GlgD [Eubacteriales bacterium]|nr:glucose-1-phosphate adenylyltransferase subunit GlgD [Eubacteriales bacterium]
MRSTMGIILTGGLKNELKELSAIRSGSAIPVAGKYRAIDFTLSNMVNSGITNVGVITQYSSRSLMDHLGSGKEWDLDRKKDGLFVFSPSLGNDRSGWYKGTADSIYDNLSYLQRSEQEYVLIAQGYCVYKMDYTGLLEAHVNSSADITLVYRKMDDFPRDELTGMGILEIAESGRVADFREKPLEPATNIASLGIYLMKRTMLISLLQESASHGGYDFVIDILIRKLYSLNIKGYEFKGYWRNLTSVQNYYRCNMEMLEPSRLYELFVKDGKIYTKVKDEAPAKYNEEAEVTNSIVADGCFIEGTVKNSVLFRGVTVHKGAVVEDSILMQGTKVEEGARLCHVITDKNVVISRDKQLKGDLSWPVTVGKNIKV